ncbi:MAG: T9SS type A sorting domain-containing protein, partial [Bacteroidales bacterium]|nr:T9SS type A sorting domain-containing protein [Bacteroidales bacterium]
HYMGSLSAQDSILFSDCFSFKIADSIPDNYFVHFEIVLKDDYDEKHYGIETKIHTPILNIINCRIDDSELGNDNNIIESGESFEIIYTVTNTGSEPATVSLISTCDNPAIIIQNISPFSLNDSSTHIIRLRISQNTTLPLGTRIRITSTIRCSHISSNTITSSIQIGGAIESFESENFSSFPWMTDRENPWTISSSTAVEGIHSAQTGSISNDQSSSLSILCLYEQADTISFYYKVSTEYLYDLFTFSINGYTQLITSGNSDWQLAKYAVYEGLNSFKWTYRKDESISSNDDCVYIDFINFANTIGVTFLTNDLSLDSIYLQTEETSGFKDISADITNNGIDTIQSFNLAYIINDGSIICEHFDVPILSGETVNVTFDTQADFQQIGDYLFEAFLFNNDDEYRLNDTIKKQITIIGNDISIAEIISPIQSGNYGKEEYVTVKVICNIASNITLLPLAFKVNNGEVKRQVFRQIVSAPIDTVIVTFKEKIDMSSFGTYNITVFSEFEDDCNRSNDTLRIRIVNNKMSTTLQAYPNPFVSEVNIAIQADGDGIATFSLFDLTGKRIDLFTIDVQEGINQIRYSLPHIPKGIYILRMSLNGKNNSIKIIKQ